jgi:hypothetical protein
MKEETYFVIHGSEDGDVYVIKETKASLLKQLHPNEYGDVEIVIADILESLPDMEMTGWDGPFILIIKGEIVIPQPLEVIPRFEI